MNERDKRKRKVKVFLKEEVRNEFRVKSP